MFDENEIENIDDNNLNGTSEEDLNADLSEKELKVNEQEEINDDEINLDDEEPVTIQPVKFSSFDSNEQTYGEPNKNLDLLLDINTTSC